MPPVRIGNQDAMDTLLPLILLCATAAVVLYFYKNGGLTPPGADTAPPLRAAAKRLDFRLDPRTDAVARISTTELCVATMASAFAQMDDHAACGADCIIASLQKHLHVDATTARDMLTVAPWIIAGSGDPTQAFERLTKRLKQMDHGPQFNKLMAVLGDVTAAGSKGMPSARQADAMGALARIFRTA